MSSPHAEIVAWAGLPLVFLLTCVGVGLLVARLLRLQLPGPLTVPVGLSTSIVAVMPGYALGADNRLAVALIVVLTVAGYLTRRRDLKQAVSGALFGPWSLGALAVAGCYLAPAALTGTWTWTGYNFVNDTAFQFLLTDWIAGHGIPFHAAPTDTTLAVTQQYLLSHYPLGAHGHLATLQGLLGTPVAVLYQTYLGLLMGTASMALYQLAARSGLRPRTAVLAATLAPLAALTYQYGMQGNIKELATFATIAVAAAVGRELLGAADMRPWAVVFGLCLAATLETFAAAGVPYVLAMSACVIVAAALTRASDIRRSLPVAAALGAGALVIFAIPSLVTIGSSLRTLNAGFANGGVAPALGQLVRQLPVSEASGIWLAGDYRFPIAPGTSALLTTIGAILIAALLIVAICALVARREPGPLVLLGTLALTYFLVSPRTAPYPDGKMLAILSPGVVFVAIVGASKLRWPGVAAMAAVGSLVLVSSAFAYHATNLAPTARMKDLADIGNRFQGRGLMLFNEYEEFAKYFMRGAHINASTDAVTPYQLQLRGGDGYVFSTYDLDLQKLSYVERFPYVVVRRGPATSRPPGNYRFIYANTSYAVYERSASGKVIEHLPLGTPTQRGGMPACTDVRQLARTARPGQMLLAAPVPAVATWNVLQSRSRPPGWPPDPQHPGLAYTATPGVAGGTLSVPVAGRYVVWVEGSFGRAMHVSLDGKSAGQVKGIDTPGGWLAADTVQLTAGRHTIQVKRDGGGLAPGDGARSTIGPVTLEGTGSDQLVRVAPKDADTLCGHSWDWIETVSGDGFAA